MSVIRTCAQQARDALDLFARALRDPQWRSYDLAHGPFEKDAVELPITGRDLRGLRAAIYLNEEQMEKIGLKPGDLFPVRVVDRAGNASEPASGEIQAQEWTGGNFVTHTVTPGLEFSALDGENVAKTVRAGVVADTRPPVLNEERLSFVTNEDGTVSLKGAVAIEDQATVEVFNLMTGATTSGTVTPGRLLEINLGKIPAGTALQLMPRDNNGVPGEMVQLVFEPNCPNGKGPKLDLPPLPGAIP